MKHAGIKRGGMITHRVASVPVKGVEPNVTYKARVKSITLTGQGRVQVAWVIWKGGKS